MSKKKTSQRIFREYVKSFKDLQSKLGLFEWEVYFDLKKLDGSYAEIDINVGGRCANAVYNSEQDKGTLEREPQISGKHECLHLLLAKLTALAKDRYVTVKEIDDEAESIVRILEKIL